MMFPLGPPAAVEDLRRAMVWPTSTREEADQRSRVPLLTRIADLVRTLTRQPAARHGFDRSHA